ncbi:hypothetical protein [Nocardia sp. bgisy134]|uniref:hypothetical protein n=1 Tax=unclassified Nocardia TaxID=2637762 RepID=UPI003D74AF8E
MDTVVESAPYMTNCIECGSLIEATVIEALSGVKHQWDLEGNCPKCECVWYERGCEAPPARMRSAILAANGPTLLQLTGDNATPAAVMRALRAVKALSLIEARSMADQLRAGGIEGTRVEMEALAVSLRASGAVISIQSANTA